MKPDKTDYLIIKELSNDARQSSTDIAKKLNINERTVRRRITQLVDNKIIRITTIVDPSHFDYKSIADINLKVTEEVYDDFILECTNNPNVCYIATGWGEANLSIEARFKDNDEMYQFIRHTLKNKPGVSVINYFIIPRIIYNIDRWLPPESDFNNRK